jgi:hypothetical protein
MFEGHRGFWIMIRQAVLLICDAIEKELALQPSTAEIRQWYKDAHPKSDG